MTFVLPPTCHEGSNETVNSHGYLFLSMAMQASEIAEELVSIQVQSYSIKSGIINLNGVDVRDRVRSYKIRTKTLLESFI